MSKTVTNKATSSKITLFFLILSLSVFVINIIIEHKHIATIRNKRKYINSTFYVPEPEAYKLFAMGSYDVASRINLLYALFTPVNYNIPSTNFKRLIASLEGSDKLDPLNIAPYLTVAHYWSWTKDIDNRKLMAEYMKPSVDKFPLNWEIPFNIYILEKDYDEEDAFKYLQIASVIASKNNGPSWVVNYPAIIKRNDGDIIGAFLWLEESYSRTSNKKQHEAIIEEMKKLIENYNGDLKPEIEETIKRLEEINNK